MRTDTDDLPPIDPRRSHLDILRDALDLMKKHQPTTDDVHGKGYSDCAECGFPLNGCISPKAGKHSGKGCDWLRAVAELEAWVRVEEQLERERGCKACGAITTADCLCPVRE